MAEAKTWVRYLWERQNKYANGEPNGHLVQTSHVPDVGEKVRIAFDDGKPTPFDFVVARREWYVYAPIGKEGGRDSMVEVECHLERAERDGVDVKQDSPDKDDNERDKVLRRLVDVFRELLKNGEPSDADKFFRELQRNIAIEYAVSKYKRDEAEMREALNRNADFGDPNFGEIVSEDAKQVGKERQRKYAQQALLNGIFWIREGSPEMLDKLQSLGLFEDGAMAEYFTDLPDIEPTM